MEIGVIYLFRWADGDLAARNFIASYVAHPAHANHELHVIFKGFPNQRALTAAQSLFTELSINPIQLEDSGYDIGSFFAAAKLVSNSRLIFFNGFTELLADSWLKRFDDALSLPGVGVVGATGSWQSLSSYYEVLVRLGLNEIARLCAYVPELIAASNAAIKREGHDSQPAIKRGLYLLFRPDQYLFRLYEYGRYPNPHIRTNAFMIERSRFLALHAPSFVSKSEAYKFESGRRSMTKQILEQGLRPIVVDRSGRTYEIPEWQGSSTYWAGQQTNLVAADNRTRQYNNGDSQLRQRLHDYAWVPPRRWKLNVHRSRLQEN